MSKVPSLLAVLSLAATLAFGQAADRPGSTTDRQDANAPATTRTDEPRDRSNWGWIGLLGLAGLGGLAGRGRRDIRDRERDTNNLRRVA